MHENCDYNWLLPETVWVEGSCYRVNIGDCKGKPKPKLVMLESMEVVDIPAVTGPVDLGDNFYNIQLNNANQYEASLPVPSQWFGLIIGQGFTRKKEIEGSTKTKITVPGKNQEADVIVRGDDAENVSRACTRIMMQIATKRSKLKPTHFIAIDLSTSEITASFLEFKKELAVYRNIDPLLFQHPMRLHLTLAMVTLVGEREVERASQLLKDFTQTVAREVAAGAAVDINLEGIDIMKDDPSCVDVLYAKVANEEAKHVLGTIGAKVIKKFKDNELLSANENETVKLHATLLNSTFKKAQSGPNNDEDHFFNAKDILNKFKNYHFGMARVDSLHLYERNSSTKDGSYKSVASHRFTSGTS